jgi:hypothetical protein
VIITIASIKAKPTAHKTSSKRKEKEEFGEERDIAAGIEQMLAS